MAGLRQGSAQAAVSAATDKRFRRAQVKPARKRMSASRQMWVIARLLVLGVVVSYAGYRSVALIAAAPALQVSHITVRGHERLSTGEVLAIVEGLRGRNILGVDLEAWQRTLLASPWVESATIRRVLPATVEVAIRERRPIAIGRLGTAMYLIDAKGVIVDEYGPAYADIDLPIVDGLAASPQDGGSIVDVVRAEFAARVIAALTARPEMLKRVSQINVADLHDAVVLLDDDTALLRLGDSDFVARLQQYLDLAPALRERLATIDYVDLRFDERLYVRPAKQMAKK